MSDDDLLRRTLREPTEPIGSSRVLQDLRPTMRRARTRRRAGVGAAAAILLAGAGAGVLALASSSTAPTIRTTPASDENGAAALLPPVTPGEDSKDEEIDPGLVSTTTAAQTAATPTTTSEPERDDRPEDPQPAPAPRASGGVPTPGVPMTPPTTEAPQPVAPPPTTAAPATQVLTSACGELAVAIDGQTVRVASITPLAGFTPRVATDGPETVEMTFSGPGRICEIHAELKAGRLDVEIQDSDD